MPIHDKLKDCHACGQQLAVFSSLARAFQQIAEAAAAFPQVAGIARCHLCSVSAKPAAAMPIITGAAA